MNSFSETIKVVQALPPAADRYNTNPATDVVSLKHYEEAIFVLEEGAGGTGTVKIQVEECSAAAGSNNVAIAFDYRVGNADGSTLGAWTASAAAGYTTTAGADKMVQVRVRGAALSDGKPWVRLQLTEVANDPCAASVLALLHGARYGGATQPTVVS